MISKALCVLSLILISGASRADVDSIEAEYLKLKDQFRNTKVFKTVAVAKAKITAKSFRCASVGKDIVRNPIQLSDDYRKHESISNWDWSEDSAKAFGGFELTVEDGELMNLKEPAYGDGDDQLEHIQFKVRATEKDKLIIKVHQTSVYDESVSTTSYLSCLPE